MDDQSEGTTVVTLTREAREAPSSAGFEAYVEARGAALVRFAILLTGDDHRAQDIVQDALAKAYLRWGSIRRIDNPDVYLRQLIANASRSWWRRGANRELPVERTADRAAPGDMGAEAVQRDELWRLIATLPHKQRAVVVLRYYEDLDDTTIGQILDCSPVTVRTHAMRALTRLRSHFSIALGSGSGSGEGPARIPSEDLGTRRGIGLSTGPGTGLSADRGTDLSTGPGADRGTGLSTGPGTDLSADPGTDLSAGLSTGGGEDR